MQEKYILYKNFTHKLRVFFLVFFFIFAPRLDLNFVLHTGFFSVLLLAMIISAKQRYLFKLPSPLLVTVAFFLSLAFYHLILATLYDNNASYFFSICVSVIISIVFGWLIASYIINHGVDAGNLLDQLLVICTISAVLNSSIILVEFFSPQIKSIIENFLLQNTEGLIYAQHAFQLRGLASAGGAGLSVFNAITVLFIIYLVRNDRLSTFFAMVGASIITFSNIFTGRTGLIFSLLFTSVLVAIILVKNLKSGIIGVIRAVSFTITFLFLFSFLTVFDLDPEVVGWAFEWVDGLLAGKFESASSDDLQTMLFLPDDPIHLLFGLGFFEGVGKIYSRTDSGYLKTILSIGIPLTFLLYFYIIFIFFKVSQVSSNYKWLVVSVLGTLLIVEVKEPFFYQNFTARVILLLSGAAMFILANRRASAMMIKKNVNHVE